MQGTGDCHYRSLVGFLSFKRHASVTVQMTRENGALYRAVVTKARIGSGKVGDGARAGTLPSAVMANHSERGGIRKCHVWPRRGTIAIELSWVLGHCVRPQPIEWTHWVDQHSSEMVEPTSAYNVGRSYCCICTSRG